MKQISEDKLNIWLKISLVVLAICLIIYLLADHVLPILGQTVRFLAPILLPFLLAFIFAILLEPLIGFCQKRLKMSRTWAVLVVLLLVFVLLAVIIGALASRLIVEISSMINYLSTLKFDTTEIAAFIEHIYSTILVKIADIDTIQQGVKTFLSSFSNLSIDFLNGVINVLRSTPATFIMLLVTILATYFFCKDKNMVLNLILKLVPKSRKERAKQTYQNTIQAFSGYFRAQFIVMAITAIWCMIGFAILGVDYVFTMGIVVGLFDILPVLGPGTLMIPWTILCLITGDFKTGIGLLIIYAVITISRQILEPKMVSQNIGLHPLATLASIFIGMKLFGVVGLIGGPIALVVILGFFKANREAKNN